MRNNRNIVQLIFISILCFTLVSCDELFFKYKYSVPENFVIKERIYYNHYSYGCYAAIYTVEGFDIGNQDAKNQGYSYFQSGEFNYEQITNDEQINFRINVTLSSAEDCLQNSELKKKYFELHANPNSNFSYRIIQGNILFYNPDTKLLFQLVGN